MGPKRGRPIKVKRGRPKKPNGDSATLLTCVTEDDGEVKLIPIEAEKAEIKDEEEDNVVPVTTDVPQSCHVCFKVNNNFVSGQSS